MDLEDQIKSVIANAQGIAQSHSGDIEFVKFENGIVYIRLLGACTQCPISLLTIKLGIEESIKQVIPQVLEVIAVN